MADPEFYRRDRPEDASLPEDRPRGGGPEDPSPRHRTPWVWVTLIVVVLAAVILVPLII